MNVLNRVYPAIPLSGGETVPVKPSLANEILTLFLRMTGQKHFTTKPQKSDFVERFFKHYMKRSVFLCSGTPHQKKTLISAAERF